MIRVQLHLFEQRHPRVLVIQLGQFAHDFAAALVVESRHNHIDGHDLVPALARPLSILHPAFAHAQLLPALRARWNLQLRAAIDCRHGMLNFIRPPICVTWPDPLHSGHCVGPPVDAWPWQVGQVSMRFT